MVSELNIVVLVVSKLVLKLGKFLISNELMYPGGFDVYNIETAMPKIDLDAIETHLRAAREEERRVS